VVLLEICSGSGRADSSTLAIGKFAPRLSAAEE